MRRAIVAVTLAIASHPAWAGGDAQRGKLAYEARCGACHSVDTDRVGPRHAGIVGRRAGSVPGFAYSDALRNSGLVWNPALLDRWLTNPEALVPGQRMGYQVADPQVRADIIAYLRTLPPQRH
ncbi:MAG: c-type cytochrome [Proteobacteria bacterium]|nr:c-type cytochrome [Pseudomonadota bacterium]MBS0464132.1 c-type cytochrome [Pseudomonadota bacterium]